MAKLGLQATPGFNAGKTYYAKPMRISDIVIDPEISAIFSMQDKTLDEIRRKMEKFGYDNSQPVVIIKGENVLVDGHTRLAAARDAGLDEVPAVEMEFESRDEALLYTFERQVLRRNLTGPEILKAARMIPGKARSGEGDQAEQMAKRLGISRAMVYQARAIIQEAPQEIVQAVENGGMSIKKGYTAIRKPKGERSEYTAPLADVRPAPIPDSTYFLKGAVILLVEAGQQEAAELLINYFLTNDGKGDFYGLLPESVRETLAGRCRQGGLADNWPTEAR